MRRLRSRDYDVNYRSRGTGRAVVLLHGLAEDLHSWSPVVAALGDFTVYAVDIRGHGGSSVGEADGTLAQLSSDLTAFVDTVSGPAAVVGYSLGGTIALHAAAQAGTPIEHVIAVASSSVVGAGAAEFFAKRIHQLETGDRQAFADGLRDDTRAQVTTDVDLDSLTDARLRAIGDGSGYINAARAMIGVREAPLTALLDAIEVPVDVVGASDDVFCPRPAADLIVSAAPEARYHEITGAGHLVSVDQPEAYAQLVRRLLKESSP